MSETADEKIAAACKCACKSGKNKTTSRLPDADLDDDLNISQIDCNMTRDYYTGESLARTKRYIRDGDVYQINFLAKRFACPYDA